MSSFRCNSGSLAEFGGVDVEDIGQEEESGNGGRFEEKVAENGSFGVDGRVGMIIERGRLKKWVQMWTRAGNIH